MIDVEVTFGKKKKAHGESRAYPNFKEALTKILLCP